MLCRVASAAATEPATHWSHSISGTPAAIGDAIGFVIAGAEAWARVVAVSDAAGDQQYK